MIRPREHRTREILRLLPKEQHAHFLGLDPEERQLLMNGSPDERAYYGSLYPAAAKRFAKLPKAAREEEVRARATERRAPKLAGPTVALRPPPAPAALGRMTPPTRMQIMFGGGNFLRP